MFFKKTAKLWRSFNDCRNSPKLHVILSLFLQLIKAFVFFYALVKIEIEKATLKIAHICGTKCSLSEIHILSLLWGKFTLKLEKSSHPRGKLCTFFSVFPFFTEILSSFFLSGLKLYSFWGGDIYCTYFPACFFAPTKITNLILIDRH